MGRQVYARLIADLDASGARYRLIEHAPEGRTELVSALRGHDLALAAECDFGQQPQVADGAWQLLLGIPATIFVPAIAGRAKIDAIRSLGADLHIGGDRYADAWAAAQTWAAESGGLQVPAFDQPETILGQ